MLDVAALPEPNEDRLPLAIVGRYDDLATARERALVAAAREVSHRIDRAGDGWVLLVPITAHDEIVRELALFEREQREHPPEPAPVPLAKASSVSLYVFAWLMGTCFFLQNIAPPEWTERGAADSIAIIQRGEWWRTLTALTLHADLPHVAANLATGVLFAVFLLPQLGTGLTWLAIVLSGGLGNLLNSWSYGREAHVTIGASTAVFGALGLLVSIDFLARWSAPHTRSRWQLVLPVGAGLALLAYLGSGGEDAERDRIDYMAHFWGFIAGLALGAVAALLRLRERTPLLVQRLAAITAVSVTVVAWRFAVT
jgi:membrane associated rhomboid family serine protease